MCVWFDARFARREQANGGIGTRRRMERRDRFALQNRPERRPQAWPDRAVLARRANRDAGCNAALRSHGRMRDRPSVDAFAKGVSTDVRGQGIEQSSFGRQVLSGNAKRGTALPRFPSRDLSQVAFLLRPAGGRSRDGAGPFPGGGSDLHGQKAPRLTGTPL